MGMGEIILVIIVAIMIWGPGKIPEMARTAGKFVNTLKHTSANLTAQITKELEEAEQGKRDHSPNPVVNPVPQPPAPLPPTTPASGSSVAEANPSPNTPVLSPPAAPKSENSGED